MRKLSSWANHHKTQARIIIILSFVLLTGLGIATGVLLKDVGVSISSIAILVTIVAYIIGVIAYPSKTLKGKKLNASVFYLRQKSCDLLLAASTFCMIVCLSNQPEKVFNYSTPLNAAIPASILFPKDSTLKTYKTIEAFKASLKDETGKSLKWKEKKKLLKEQIRGIKKSDEMSKGAKLALIILSVAVASGLFYLVMVLACNLSCNGSEGAAALVAIGGVGLVVFLLLIAIRAIVGRKKNPKPSDSKPG